MLSIVTPVLNGEKWIEKNIASVCSLNIPVEHLVVDGGSTDRTPEIISAYSHIRMIRQEEKKGMYHAIDLGIRNSTGEFVTWVNCDDQVVPEGYERMYRKIEGDKKCGFVYSDGLIIYENEGRKKYLKGSLFPAYFLSRGIFPLCQPSSVFRKEIYMDSGGFDYMNYKIIGDYDLFLRFSRMNQYSMNYIPWLSSIFLVHGNNLSDTGAEKAKEEKMKNNIPEPSRFEKFIFSLLISKYFPTPILRTLYSLNGR